MKRIFIIVGIISITILISYLIPVEQSYKTTIAANFFNTIQQINDPDRWKNWHPAIEQAWEKDSTHCNIIKNTADSTVIIITPQHSISIKAISPVMFEIQEKIQQNLYIYGLTIVSTLKSNRIDIVVVKKENLLNVLFSFLNKNTPDNTTINSLKYFVENPAALYKFNIKIIRAEDTIFATKRGYLLTQNLLNDLPKYFESVENYIATNNLTISGNRCVSYSIADDSIFVMTGIPVNKSVPEKDGISCMEIPGRSRVLYAYYEGIFRDRQQVYQAMEKYISDFNLSKAALPYERYGNNILPASLDSKVKIEFFYPLR